MRLTSDRKNVLIALLVTGWTITFGIFGVWQDAWETDVVALHERIGKLEKSGTAIDKQLEEAKDALRQRSIEEKQRREEVSRLRTTLGTITQKVTAWEALRVRLEGELRRRDETIEELQNQLRDAQRELERQARRGSQLEKELALKDDVTESLRLRLQVGDAIAEELRKQLAVLDERLQQKEQELRASNESIEELRNRLREQ